LLSGVGLAARCRLQVGSSPPAGSALKVLRPRRYSPPALPLEPLEPQQPQQPQQPPPQQQPPCQPWVGAVACPLPPLQSLATLGVPSRLSCSRVQAPPLRWRSHVPPVPPPALPRDHRSLRWRRRAARTLAPGPWAAAAAVVLVRARRATRPLTTGYWSRCRYVGASPSTCSGLDGAGCRRVPTSCCEISFRRCEAWACNSHSRSKAGRAPCL